MVDYIRPLKLEDLTTGSQEDLFPSRFNATEDVCLAYGLAVQDSTTTITKDGSNNLQFTDI